MPWTAHLHRLISREFPSELYWQGPERPAGPDDVRFTWLGTAGFVIDAAGQRLLIDPYLSRHSLRQCVSGPLLPDDQEIHRRVPRADLVLAGHAHHDHAADLGSISSHTGAEVLGCESAIRVARLHGADPALLHPLAAGDEVERGPFRIRARRSVHGRVAAGRIPYPGSVEATAAPMRISDYRVGASLVFSVTVGGTRFVHLGSANVVESALDGLECDVLLLCIVGRQRCPDFVGRVLRRLRPTVVIPSHWDYTFLPLTEPARQMPTANVEGFVREVAASGVPVEQVFLPLLGSYVYGG
jgi:L-ascorbate metabolism protein UlaG (beta-lactamase superfamily)